MSRESTLEPVFPSETLQDDEVRAQSRCRGKPLIAVTRDVYRQFLCEKVIPAIGEKWPVCHRSVCIKIQQDNAPPHLIPANDPQFQAAVAATGLSICLVNQPPNSPDTNILDLGFFNAVQSLQHQKNTNTIPELVKAVEDSFNEQDRITLNKVFLTYQQCLEQIILCEGGNNYKIPHMGKERLARQGQLPVSIGVSHELQAKIGLLQQGDAVAAVI